MTTTKGAVLLVLALAPAAWACGARTSVAGPAEQVDAGASADASPDASPWVPVDTECSCPVPELLMDAVRGPPAQCGVESSRSYLIGNCGDEAVRQPVTVELWTGDALWGPEDPEAVRLDAVQTAAGMPPHHGQWVDFEYTLERQQVIRQHRDSVFVWFDPDDAIVECDNPDSAFRNVGWDGLQCVDP